MKPFDQQSDAELLASLRRAAELPDAPASVVQAAIDLWPAVSPLAQWTGDALRRLRAVLSFDSWAGGPLALGLRGGETASRQRVFSAEGRDIDLRVEPTPDGYVVSGQVLGPDERGLVALQRVPGVAERDAATLRAAIDDMGEFRFRPVGRGTYQLTLQLPDVLIDLPDIEIGDRP